MSQASGTSSSFEQPAPRGAVFLSYASQDAEPVKKICDALRAAGVEVWFDQSELTGGDAWDQKIRGQIKTCALFAPIISANTQSREEGYFRREWNLAAQRTLDMAHDKAFLLPIVIDDTPDATARVPEKFREVQWTRLPGGETNRAFCDRVKKLLGGSEMEMARLTFPPANPAAPARAHVHGHVEVLYILSGELDHIVNGVSHPLKAGMAGIVRPGDQVTHKVLSSDSVRVLVIWAPGSELVRYATPPK